MNKLQKKILIFIGILLFIIILIFLKLNNEKNNTINNEVIVNINEITNNSIVDEERNGEIAYEGPEVINDIKKLKNVKDKTTYFTLDALYQNFINLIANERKQELMSVISSKYIKEYNINESNILNIMKIPKITNNNQYYKIIILDMLTAQIDQKTSLYIIKGKGRIVGNEDSFEYNIMIEIDEDQGVYSVYPYKYLKDKGYDKLKEGSIINYTANNIIKNENNEFVYNLKDDLEMAKKYFSNYAELLAYYKEEAYSKLNSKYIEKKFSNKQSFYNYLDKIKYTIYTMQINEYRVYSTQEYTDYICTDQYNNYYIFRQQDGIMNYTVYLDLYTTELDSIKEYYIKANDETKLVIQIGKFNQMLNTKDYDAIYNKLNKTFKENNFSSVEKLESYLKTNTYEINTISIEETAIQEEYYICSCVLTNQLNKEQSKKINVVLKLVDSNNFEISFSI